MRQWASHVWYRLTLTWAAVIALLTLVPSERLPQTPAWRLLSFDTAAHAGVFAVLAVLLYQTWRMRSAPTAFWGTFGAALLFGALIEWLQTTMGLGRHGEWSDLLSDGLGALGGAALARYLPRPRP